MNVDSQQALLWHPLEASLDRGLVVSIQINGKLVKAAIDTGDTLESGLVLTSSAASRLGIVTTKEKSKTLNYLGPHETYSGVADSVVFGGISFLNAPVSIEQHLGYDPDVEAIIGVALLKYVTLVVDPGNHRVRFLLSGELASLSDGINVIPLKDGLRYPASSVEVKYCNGDSDLLVDTGDNGDVRLKSSLFQQAGCRSTVESDARSEGSSGAQISRRVGLADASMNGISLGPVLAEDIPDDRAQALGINGAIGLGVLSRFSFALDISSRRLLILGYSAADSNSGRPTIGLEFERLPGAIEITHVEANSPASKSSLRTGDKICFVGGESISQLGGRFDTNPPPGSELKLKTCDGRPVSIIASDFLFPAGLPNPTRTNFAITGVGDFTGAVVNCLYGDDEGKTASCTKVIDAPPETRSVGDFRIVAFLFRAKGKSALGDAKGAQEDYRHVLELDPNNTAAAAALKGAGS